MNHKPLILIIDDELPILKTLKEALQDEHFRVETLADPVKALDLIGQLIPDLILLDISMPHVNGIELLSAIKREYPQQKVIIISGYGNIPIALDAVKKGAVDFIEKPLNLDEILAKLDFLKQESSSQEQASADGTFQHEAVVGQSYLFLELMAQVNQLATLTLPLLLYGKPGTGKSLLAYYIHQKSSFAGDVFSTLYGEHDYTDQQLDELFVQSGTLYLKNVHHLSAEQQKKILVRVQQHHARLRLVASSCPSLFHLMQKGLFNVSLFHKLNAIPLEIPPLSKRPYDIPLLAHYFLENKMKELDKNIVLTTSSIRALRNHVWTGNVAELKQFIEKLVLLAPQDHYVVTPEELQKYLHEKDLPFIEEQTFATFNSLQEATSTFEKKFLIYLLKKNRYDLIQVSDRLSLKLPQLRSKMQELNIEFKM